MEPIAAYVPIARAQGRFADIFENIRKSGDTVAITENGVPEAVILPYAKFDALLETMEILADRHLMAQSGESEKDIAQGRLVDLDEAF